MVDPIIGGGILLVLNDAYSRLVTAGMQRPDYRTSTINSGIQTIQQAINSQNQAHFRAAEMALGEGKFDKAIDHLRLGLANDEMNVHGWGLYAKLLSHEGNHEQAFRTYLTMINWFGPDCPALPQEIRDTLSANNDVVVPSASPITKKMERLYSTSIRLTQHGAFGIGAGVGHSVLRFYPWHDKKPHDICLLSQHESFFATERFVVTGSFYKNLYDLAPILRGEEKPVESFNRNIPALFGHHPHHEPAEKYRRGADISVKPGTDGSILVSAPKTLSNWWNGVFNEWLTVKAYDVTVTPKIVTPTPNQVELLSPDIIQALKRKMREAA